MNYIDMVNAKVEALSAAKEALSVALLECKDHLVSFDNADTYAHFSGVGDTGFFDLVRVLDNRLRMVKRDLEKVDSALCGASEELRLLSWGECEITFSASREPVFVDDNCPF